MSFTERNIITLNRFLWLMLPALQIALLCMLPAPANETERMITGTFLLITGFSSYQLFTDARPYSLNKIWWLFGAIFLGFVPSVQAAVHHSPWRNGDILPQTMLFANGLILACFALYFLVRRFLPRPTGPDAVTRFPDQYIQRFRVGAPLLMLACLACLFFAYGPKGLLLRGHAEAAAMQYNSAFQLLFDKGLRGVMLYLSIAAILLYRQKALSGAVLGFLLAIAFMGNFPLALPRYLAFTIYLSWLLAAGFCWMQKRHLFTMLILSLLLLAGPIMDVTRYAGIDMQERIQSPAELFKKSYLTSDFDAYSSLCRVMQFTQAHGATHGRQLSGVVLFFIPRSIWPGKPIGSGAFIFTDLGAEFKNVSCTYLAEGYINWGLLGSLLFTLALTVLITRYDSYYSTHTGALACYKTIFYFVLCGMLLFLLRGDLLSSFAYTFGLLFSGWLTHRIIMGRIFIKKN